MHQIDNGLLKQWQAFIDITKNIKKMDNNKSVQEIIEVVINTIEKVDGGFLLLWNTKQNALSIEAAVNFKEEYYIHNKLAPGEGISGTVFKTGKTMVIYGEEEIKKAMQSMKEPNYQYFLKSSVQDDPPKSCLSVPITYKNEKIGVLTLDNFFSEERFTDEEIGFVEAIATQIAMVITLSQELNEREQSAQTLKLTLSSHHHLNDLMLNDRGSKQIIETLAKLIDNPIIYLDPKGEFLFTSNPNDPFELTLKDWIKKCIHQFPTEQQDFEFLLPNQLLGHIFKIASSYGVIGYLLVICNSKSLDVYTKLTLSHSTAIMAIEQMKEQKKLESRIQKRQLLLKQFHEENSFTSLHNLLEINYYNAFLFLLYKGENYLENNYSEMFHYERDYKLKLQSIGNCLLFPNRDSLIVLIALRDTQSEVEKKLEEIFLFNQDERILIGRKVDRIDQLHLSFQDIERLKHCIKNLDGQIISYEKLGLYRYLLSMTDSEQKHFVEEILGPILPSSIKQSSNNELIHTLMEYFKYNKNVIKTAEAMHVHQNTIYYRIVQIEEKLKVDLNDFNYAMNIHAAIFLYNLR